MAVYTPSGQPGPVAPRLFAGGIFALLMILFGFGYGAMQIWIGFLVCDPLLLFFFKAGILGMAVAAAYGIQFQLIRLTHCRSISAWAVLRVPGIILFLLASWIGFAVLFRAGGHLDGGKFLAAVLDLRKTFEVAGKLANSGFSGYSIFQGWLLWLAWLCEAVVLAAAFHMGEEPVASSYYCEPCGAWLRQEKTGTFKVHISKFLGNSLETTFSSDADAGRIEMVRRDFFPHIEVTLLGCPVCRKNFLGRTVTRLLNTDQKEGQTTREFVTELQSFPAHTALKILEKA